MTTQPRNAPQFYLTAPTPCPYLPGRKERKVFTHIVGRHAEELHDILAQGGFRRSQTLAYRPICDSCQSCVSVRIIANDFKLSRGFRRIYTHNADINSEMVPPQATAEQYDLFCVYLQARHSGGGMARMSMDDYAGMVEDTHINTRIIEYRLGNGELVAVSLTDVLQDGLSMVYSFYNPAFPHRSLGTYLILDHIARTRMLGLPFLYLGYWVDGSTNMAYKSRFLPQERLLSEGWVRIDHTSPGKAP